MYSENSITSNETFRHAANDCAVITHYQGTWYSCEQDRYLVPAKYFTTVDCTSIIIHSLVIAQKLE